MISILFPYRGDDGPRDQIFGHVLHWWKRHFPEAQICVGRNFDQPFNRGTARNDAYQQSTGQLLIVADADTMPTLTGVRDAIADVAEAQCWSLPYGETRYYNLTQETTRYVLDRKLDRIPEPTQFEHKVTSWAGCLVMTREAWETVGGYREDFTGWGYEDNYMALKLDTFWGPCHRQASYCCHLWHPIAKENTFEQPTIGHNRALYQRALRGDFT